MMDLRKIPLEEPEDGVFQAYANVVNLNWTLFDIRIRFAELMQVRNGAGMVFACNVRSHAVSLPVLEILNHGIGMCVGIERDELDERVVFKN